MAINQYVPTNLASLVDETTALSVINNNFAQIAQAFQNAAATANSVSNNATMQITLDMNSNQVINLPIPASVNSPARLIDVVSNPSLLVPPTGTSGHTVTFLDTASTWSALQTFNNGIAPLGQTISNSPTGNATGGSL